LRAGRFLIISVCLAIMTLSGFGTGTSGASDDPDHTALREVPVPRPGEIGPDRPATDPGLPMAPPDDPQVGDSWLWWLWVHFPMPPHFEQKMCTVRGKTDRGYVVVEDSQWEVNIFQEDVDLILERWENSSIGPYPDMGIYEIDSLSFGDPPDELDNDPRIYLMWFDFGIPSDGFFFYFDEYPEGTFPGLHSNECEVLYLNPANGQNPSGDYMISVIAHEFEHMIHWKYDENEDSWVDEGLAELAMWFYGRPDVISGFNSNPDNPLTQWDGTWADYIKTYLWSLYFFERYGGHETIYAALHEPANSILGYENVLDDFGYQENFADVFADWTVANFLDDPTLEDGRFGYVGDDLPQFNVMGTYSTYPVGDQVRTVQHWATDYYRFRNMDGFEALELGFDGSDNNVFAVWGLAIYADATTEVHRMIVDGGTQSGSLTISGLDHPDDEVILVVASISNLGTPSYVFNAAPAASDVPDVADGALGSGEVRPGAVRMSGSPNPFRNETVLTLAWEGEIPEVPRVDIYDVQGRLVRTLAVREGARGSGTATDPTRVTLVWDGRDVSGHLVAPGTYYARARSAMQRLDAQQKIVILR
jgi:hypothetical protein